ncbi:MAG TPA: DUF47 family protein [Candidatus Eremiobacteraceae bacterium]|nr:DUF47 family protein [Candidatus Eremiobacteraceae bacterium]
MWLTNLFGSAHGDRFFRLLREHTRVLCEVAELLVRFVAGGDSSLPEVIDMLEHRSDELVMRMTEALKDTFVTPIDRQDLYGLTEAIDDMVVYLNNASREIGLMRVTPTPQMIEMAKILAQAARDVDRGIDALTDDPVQASDAGRAVMHAESLVENIYRDVICTLFDAEDLHRALKLREIYRHLSNCADRADSTGRLIGKIVVKTT